MEFICTEAKIKIKSKGSTVQNTTCMECVSLSLILQYMQTLFLYSHEKLMCLQPYSEDQSERVRHGVRTCLKVHTKTAVWIEP